MQNTMLSAAIEDYLSHCERALAHSENTINSARMILTQFLRHTGDKQMGHITGAHVYDWFYGPGGLMDGTRMSANKHYTRKMEPLAPSSHNLYRVKVNGFFNWALAKGMIKVSPMENIRPRKVPKKNYLRPSPRVLLDLLDTAKHPRDRGFLAVCMNSGLRSSEICAIKVSQVDLDEGYIYDVVIKKTGDTDDQPITADLDRELRTWLTAYAAEINRPFTDDDYLFPAYIHGVFGAWHTEADGSRWQEITPTKLQPTKPIGRAYTIVQKALKEVGIDSTRGEGVHTVRRAVARAYFDMLVASGEPDIAALRMVQSLLHHSMLATTERYIGLDQEKTKRNRSLRGKPFLAASLVEEGSVVPLRRTTLGE